MITTPNIMWCPKIQGSHSDWKTGENGKAFSSQGKSQGIFYRLEKSGEMTQNTGKLQEFGINII